jgi:hypothetical protein
MRQRGGKRRGRRSHCWRSLQLSRCYLGATNHGIDANQLVALAGGAGVEPRLRRVWRPPGLPMPRPFVVLLSLLRPVRKSKEPLPYGSGSSGHGPVKVQFRPSSTPPWAGVRRTCLGRWRRAMLRATPTGPSDLRPTGGSGRSSRRCTAWTESIWMSERYVKTPMRIVTICATESSQEDRSVCALPSECRDAHK